MKKKSSSKNRLEEIMVMTTNLNKFRKMKSYKKMENSCSGHDSSLKKFSSIEKRKRLRRTRPRTNQNSVEKKKNRKKVLKILDQNNLPKNQKKKKVCRGKKGGVDNRQENRLRKKTTFSNLKNFVGSTTLKGYQTNSSLHKKYNRLRSTSKKRVAKTNFVEKNKVELGAISQPVTKRIRFDEDIKGSIIERAREASSTVNSQRINRNKSSNVLPKRMIIMERINKKQKEREETQAKYLAEKMTNQKKKRKMSETKNKPSWNKDLKSLKDSPKFGRHRTAAERQGSFGSYGGTTFTKYDIYDTYGQELTKYGVFGFTRETLDKPRWAYQKGFKSHRGALGGSLDEKDYKRAWKAAHRFGRGEKSLHTNNNSTCTNDCSTYEEAKKKLDKGEKTTSLDDYYLEGKKLGEGAYAVVRPATHRETKKLYAIKTFNKLQLTTVELKEAVENEVNIIKDLDHPNIVTFIDKFENRRNIHLVMEHCGEYDLRSKLMKKGKGKIKHDQKITIFKEIVKAIGYLHDKNYAHCDIKLENIVIGKMNKVKLVDFGFAKYCKDGEKSSIISGTQYYMAPELIKRESHYPKPADIWALGVLLYFILTKKLPFDAKKETELMLKIINLEINYSLIDDQRAVRLLKKMFLIDVDLRADWKEIINSEFLAEKMNKGDFKGDLAGNIVVETGHSPIGDDKIVDHKD